MAQIKQIPFDASKLHSSPTMAAQHNMVDDGSGKVEVFTCFCSFVCPCQAHLWQDMWKYNLRKLQTV